MNWVFYTPNQNGNVDLDVTREHPSITNTAPNRAKCRIGNPPINGIGDLSGNLRQTEASIQNCVQAVPSVDDRGGVNVFSIWTNDPVLV